LNRSGSFDLKVLDQPESRANISALTGSIPSAEMGLAHRLG
jgi:hypothetical protein